jgi:hypothetical protein
VRKRHRVGRKLRPYTGPPPPSGYSAASEDIRSRAARVLGWSETDARSFSLQALRDIVRPVDPKLAQEISERVSSGRVLF